MVLRSPSHTQDPLGELFLFGTLNDIRTRKTEKQKDDKIVVPQEDLHSVAWKSKFRDNPFFILSTFEKKVLMARNAQTTMPCDETPQETHKTPT